MAMLKLFGLTVLVWQVFRVLVEMDWTRFFVERYTSIAIV